MSELELWNFALDSLRYNIENYELYCEKIIYLDWVPAKKEIIQKTLDTMLVIRFLYTNAPTSIVPEPWGGICVYFNNKEITFHNDGEIEFFEPKR